MVDGGGPGGPVLGGPVVTGPVIKNIEHILLLYSLYGHERNYLFVTSELIMLLVYKVNCQ